MGNDLKRSSNEWHEMVLREAAGRQQWAAEVRVPASSPWFCGHFPDMPVLPAIAQLGMVFDLIRLAAGRPVRVTKVSRVRFKQMIVPGDSITILAASRPGQGGAFSFRIVRGDDLICNGLMTVDTDPATPEAAG